MINKVTPANKYMLESEQIAELKSVRQKLHSMPEISGSEKKTAEYISEQLKNTGADRVLEGVGGHGVIAFFDGDQPEAGKTVMIRAELDALAIDEDNDFGYSSQNTGRMHACGHDGHMAIVLGVARWLKENRPEKGRILLLFQSAEETGEGAGQMLNDPAFAKLEIDRGIALHNLPGYKKNTIYIRSKTFALASVGIRILFRGRSSHAAYPEQGINPSAAISKLIQELEKIMNNLAAGSKFRVLTITYIKVGEPAFGINPGYGELGVTIRAETDKSIDRLAADVEDAIERVRGSFKGDIKAEKKEPFAATVNDEAGVEQLQAAAEKLSMDIEKLDRPIAWSEDFGKFRKKCPITLFGLGSGEQTPPLHSENYDFDDDLIPAGVSIFCEWIKEQTNGK